MPEADVMIDGSYDGASTSLDGTFAFTTFAQLTDGRKHILDFTLEQLEGMVNPADYFRINRKYMIHSKSILDMISYTNSRLKLRLQGSDDSDIIVARERVQEFKDWLDR